MKLAATLLVLFFIHYTSAYSAWANWKSRMNNYAALLNCSYYLTSESTYRDYFYLGSIADDAYTKYRFYSLSQNVIRFRLSDVDLDINPFYGPPDPQNSYDIVISSVTSVDTMNGQRMKRLATPNILRTDQPNEILVERLGDGKLRLTINENTPLEIRAGNVDQLNYISFASNSEDNVEEFFHNCNNDIPEPPTVKPSTEETSTEEPITEIKPFDMFSYSDNH